MDAAPSVTVTGGPRPDWTVVPEPVRARVDAGLGSPVVRWETQYGGFSPGVAVRLWCADGSTAFAKGVSTVLNPDTPTLHRREAQVAAALPADAPVPAFRFVVDDGDWVVLVFAAAPGRLPPLPWTPAAAHRVADRVQQLSAALTPCPPLPVPTAADLLAEDLTAWAQVAADPPADLGPDLSTRLDDLAACGPRLLGPGAALTGDTLVHLDLRADNILLATDGGAVFVDWPWACRGPQWLDVVLFAIDPLVYGGVDPELLLAGRLADVDPEAVTDLLLALAGMWFTASRRPAWPGMPTLRAHQRRCHDAVLAWGLRRRGWE